ncbi:MAG: nucleotidyltransferase family protein [Blastocatellia bacterium]|nr:nucleotidyltransferase family protein [Blastocatellia bacterium]
MKFEEVPVALLAGGLATRLRPVTETIPKALVSVAGKPFLAHQLELLRETGIRRVVLCLGHLGELVQTYLTKHPIPDLCLSYSYDGKTLLGTGGALRRAAPQLGEVFWVLYGDSYLRFDYQAVFDGFAVSGAQGLMTVLRNGNRWDKSNVVFQNGTLKCYDKHHPLPEMDYIDYGAALLRRAALERIPPDTFFDLADLYHNLVETGEMIGYEVTERFYEIGTPQGLQETEAFLKNDNW